MPPILLLFVFLLFRFLGCFCLQIDWSSSIVARTASARSDMSGLVFGNKMYGCGGRNRLGVFDCFFYDFENGNGSILAPPNYYSCYRPAGTLNTLNGKFYLYGGFELSFFSGCSWTRDGFFEYSPETNSFVRLNVSNPMRRLSHTMVYSSSINALIVYGGQLEPNGAASCANSPLSDVYEYYFGRILFSKKCNLEDTESWNFVPTTNAPTLSDHSAVVYEDGMYVFGGSWSAIDYFNDIWLFNITTKEWKLLDAQGTPPSPRCCTVMAVLGKQIIIHGGSYQDTFYSDMYFYDIETNTWGQSNVNNPFRRGRHIGGVSSEKLYIFGGLSGASDPTDVNTWSFHNEIIEFTPSFNFVQSSESVQPSSDSKVAIIVGVLVPLIVAIVAIIVVIIFVKRRKNKQEEIELQTKHKTLTDIVLQERIEGTNFYKVGDWNGTQVFLKAVQHSKEAEYLRKLNHPNIMRFLGDFKHTVGQFIVTEFMSKGFLDEFLRKNGESLESSDLIDISSQITAALIYLEENFIIPKGFAINNILVKLDDRKATIKLTEFGTDKNSSKHYYSNAPEVLQGQEWKIKSSVWTLGVLFWEVFQLAKEKPFSGLDKKQIVQKIESGYNLTKPEKCPDFIYSVMNSCWKSIADRPTFEEIFKKISGNVNEDMHEQRISVSVAKAEYLVIDK